MFVKVQLGAPHDVYYTSPRVRDFSVAKCAPEAEYQPWANRVQPANSKGGNWWQSPLCGVSRSGVALSLSINVSGVYISYPFCAQKCTYCNFADRKSTRLNSSHLG